MIDPKELRLGNLVLEAGEPSHIYSISSGGISFYTINGINVNKETGCTLNGGEERFKPIPITGEWLKILGFGLEEYYARIGKFTLKQTYDGYVPVSDQYSIGVEIKHVHQLQNLFFALTGEELTVKEKA